MDQLNSKLEWACRSYGVLTAEAPKNPYEANKQWQKIAKALMEYAIDMSSLGESYSHALEALENDAYYNSRLPWAPEEDQILVEMKAEGESVLNMALSLHRSPVACSTRLSELVGIERRVTRVNDRKIVGILDNENVEGRFTGEMHK